MQILSELDCSVGTNQDNKEQIVFFSPESLHLKTRDLVWMIKGNFPRINYPLARVKSLNYGDDGVA